MGGSSYQEEIRYAKRVCVAQKQSKHMREWSNDRDVYITGGKVYFPDSGKRNKKEILDVSKFCGVQVWESPCKRYVVVDYGVRKLRFKASLKGTSKQEAKEATEACDA